jgi:two-component system, cell cycle sensor histidine kinase and response regulator CckA
MRTVQGVSAGAAEGDLRLLVSRVHDEGIFLLDPHGFIQTWTGAAERMTGLRSEDAIGSPISVLYLSEDIIDGKPLRDMTLARTSGQFRDEGWKLRRPDTKYWAEMLLCRLPEEASASGFGVILRDTTGRHRSEQFVRSVLDHTLDAIISLDTRGRILSFNRAAERIFGYAELQIVGQNIGRLIAEPYQGDAEDYLAKFVRLEGARVIGPGREATGRRQDGSTFPMDLAISRFVLEGQTMVTAMVRDLTPHKQLEAQLHQSQKMEAMGQLAGGVAHDFNNLLMVVAGYCESLRRHGEASDLQRAGLEQIAIAADKAAELTAQLLAFSRRAVIEPKVLDLNTALAQTGQLLQRTIGEHVAVTMQLAGGAIPVRMDPGHVGQIVINLAVNARDAMPHGGTFAIRTTLVTLDAEESASYGLATGEYARLEISDTGTGMTPEIKARAFEPFFTTKPTGRGTGLGLATVYGIVKQSGGHIDLDTRPDEGTAFTILLPKVEEAALIESSPKTPSVRPPTGTETVLVVEDEAAVREIVTTMLRELGYKTIEAGSVHEALAFGEARASEIDLLVSDVIMPDLSGRQLAERLWQIRPTMKVVFMSGYTDDTVLTHGVEHSDVGFLQKPFTRMTLARKVREILDRS